MPHAGPVQNISAMCKTTFKIAISKERRSAFPLHVGAGIQLALSDYLQQTKWDTKNKFHLLLNSLAARRVNEIKHTISLLLELVCLNLFQIENCS